MVIRKHQKWKRRYLSATRQVIMGWWCVARADHACHSMGIVKLQTHIFPRNSVRSVRMCHSTLFPLRWGHRGLLCGLVRPTV